MVWYGMEGKSRGRGRVGVGHGTVRYGWVW